MIWGIIFFYQIKYISLCRDIEIFISEFNYVDTSKHKLNFVALLFDFS